MTHKTTTRSVGGALALAVLAGTASSQELIPEWVTVIDTGTALASGAADAVVEASGVTYLVGTTGPSGNTDTIAAAVGPDGAVLWEHVYNGPGDWHDQGRAVALAPGGRLYMSGNTPSASKRAQVLLLEYDRASGALLSDTIFSTDPGYSESGYDLVVEDDGEILVGGGTNGDGSDALLVKFDQTHRAVWHTTWDGPAWGPYSQDSVRELAIAPDGNLIMRPHGVMADLQPDYVLLKYDPADGSIIWENNYGTRAGEYSAAMVMDDAGDIYVTGTGLDGGDAFFTVKVDGETGAEIWRAYDQFGIDDHAWSIALDGEGGVYITGDADVDGDESNFNDLIYAVKRDAQTGGSLWDFVYGQTCKRCFDVPSDIEVDAFGNLLLLGSTASPPYSGDTILFKLDRETGFELERGTTRQAPSGAMHFDASHSVYITTGTFNATTGQTAMVAWKLPPQGARCIADCDGDGSLTFFDFLCFQNQFAAGDPAADCDGDGSLSFFDFLCFQNAFAAGCA
ncbi:MAG: GC-type dockerin domain-anchored protein [Phycisphaerales bacterium JB039]